MAIIKLQKSPSGHFIAIPEELIQQMSLENNMLFNLSITDDNKIILTPEKEELSLNKLLENTTKDAFKVTEEDREWIDAKPRGKEI